MFNFIFDKVFNRIWIFLNKRKLTAEYEDAIYKWYILQPKNKNPDDLVNHKYEFFAYMMLLDKNKFYHFINENSIKEIKHFIDWLSKKTNVANDLKKYIS